MVAFRPKWSCTKRARPPLRGLSHAVFSGECRPRGEQMRALALASGSGQCQFPPFARISGTRRPCLRCNLYEACAVGVVQSVSRCARRDCRGSQAILGRQSVHSSQGGVCCWEGTPQVAICFAVSRSTSTCASAVTCERRGLEDTSQGSIPPGAVPPRRSVRLRKGTGVFSQMTCGMHVVTQTPFRATQACVAD
jgi:hypothetical protein